MPAAGAASAVCRVCRRRPRQDCCRRRRREPVFLIAGPCVIESEAHALGLAAELARRARARNLRLIFKASYDKANRSSVRGFRGPGLAEGLRVLAEVKRQHGLEILTDVHQVSEVAAAAEVADVLQIPAFLCRQTDLIQAAARTGRIVNIKKGQFMAPWDMKGAVEKARAARPEVAVWLTERGSSFGYNNLVVDMRSLAVLRDFGAPVIFDVTHSLQLPGAAGDKSGGTPQFIEVLARAGAAAGVDGLFLETHEDPPQALSDGANALPLARLDGLLDQVLAVEGALARFKPLRA
ncbi:MAG: 3-deoxy-8-phosphooctulonate synthase [Acidobacteria bacterium]|nr:MAG: 3-deoxy-8-phosphooctulonate synthase [Acidobacteriota bacterium]